MLTVASNGILADAGGYRVTEDQAKQERYACGARAAFALIRMRGGDVDYAKLYNSFAFSKDGASLDEVARVLCANGLECTCRRLELTELRSVPVPFIVHLTRHKEIPRVEGHFFIVTGIDGDSVRTYDPTYNKHDEMKWRRFADRWYGYLIVPSQSTWWGVRFAAMIGMGVLLLLLLTSLRRREFGSWFVNRVTILWVCVSCAFLGSAQSTMASEQEIRSIMTSAPNAAAILGGIYGVDIPPASIGANKSGLSSLSDIQARLNKHGLKANVSFLGYYALIAAKRPCVVLMRSADPKTQAEESSYCVFVQASDEDVFLVASGALAVRIMSIDEFRRCWTGYAVFCEEGTNFGGSSALWACFGLSIPLSVHGVFVLRKRSSKFRRESE